MKGIDNPAADTLSGIGAKALQVTQPPVLDFEEMAAAKQLDPDLLKLRTSHASLTLKEVPLPMSDKSIVCDVSTGVSCPFFPSKFCRSVFDSLHSLSNPDIRAAQKLVTPRYVWPSINSDV